MSVTPPTNLDPNSAPWGRSVNSSISDLQTKLTQQSQKIINLSKKVENQILGVTTPPVNTTSVVASDSIKSLGVRTNTVTNSPVALYIDASGDIGISASTRAKKNITGDYKVDMQKFLAIGLKNWNYINNPQATGMGPIADDLDAAGLTDFVIYNLDGTIQGVRTDMLLIGLWSAYIQSRAITQARIADQLYQSKTVTGMTALTLGGTKPYPIVWDKPFADANYQVSAQVYSTSGIPVTGAVAAVVQSSKTTAGCTVQVASGVTLLAGQTLVVEATHI